MTLGKDLERWLTAGLIDAPQAARIREFEALHANSSSAGRAEAQVTVTEVVAYLGAVVLLVGISFLVLARYRELGAPGRSLVLGLVSAAGLGFGLIMARRPESRAARRASAAGFLVGTIGFFGLASQSLVDAHAVTRADRYGNEDTSGDIMVAAFAAALLAGALLWRCRAALLALALSGLSYGGVAALEAWAGQSQMGWRSLAGYLAAGVLLFGYAEFLIRRFGGHLAVDLLRFAALIVPFFAAMLLSFNEPWLESLAVALAISAFVLSIAVRSVGLMIAGGIALFVAVVEVGFRHFAQTLGYPVILIAGGVGLLALSLAFLRLLSQLRMPGSSRDVAED